jgi:hypothetical protein
VIGDDEEETGNDILDIFVNIVKEGQKKAQGAQKDLQKESFWQRMTGIARGETEYDPRWHDKEELVKQGAPALIFVEPLDNIVQFRDLEVHRQNLILHMKYRLKEKSEKAYNDQHLHGWKRHQTTATDVVAYEIARTRQ